MSLEKTTVLPVGPDDAFALLTDPDRLRRWHTVSARVDLRAGGEYRWTIVPGHIARGTFKEVVPGKRIVFGWGWEDSADLGPDASVVTVTFEPHAEGTLVRLVHDGLTDEQTTGHNLGWTHYFERLHQAAASGDAGPDEWASAPGELNRLTCAYACLAVLQHSVRDTTDADLTRQTPCTEFTVAQLGDHLANSLTALGGLAGRTIVDPGGSLEPRLASMGEQALEAWWDRGLDGTVDFGGQPAPAALPANVLSLELLIHAWDFATALGRQVAVSDDVAAFVGTLAAETIQPPLRDQVGFGPAIDAGPDAGSLERLLAFTGRAT